MQRTKEQFIRSIKPDKVGTAIDEIRSLYPAIEDAKKSGVSHIALIAHLKEIGINVTVKSLSRMLMQVRREQGVVEEIRADKSKRGISANAAGSTVNELQSSNGIIVPTSSGPQQVADQFISRSSLNTLIRR